MAAFSDNVLWKRVDTGSPLRRQSVGVSVPAVVLAPAGTGGSRVHCLPDPGTHSTLLQLPRERRHQTRTHGRDAISDRHHLQRKQSLFLKGAVLG